MKIVSLTALAAAGAIVLVVAICATPIEGQLLGGGFGLALTGAGMIAFGMALHQQRAAVRAEAQPAPTAAPAPLPRFFAEERARLGGEVVAFGRKQPGCDAPELPPMLEAQLSRQMLRRAERICAAKRE